MPSRINYLVRQFDASYTGHINLVASENVSSPNVRNALQSDLNHRYVMPPKEERDPALWEYPNQEILLEIVKETQDVACDIFGAKHADISPLSGNQVADIMLNSLLSEGDSFLSVGANEGGHFATQKIATKNSFNRIDLPYRDGEIDIEKTKVLALQNDVKLVFLDASMITHPYPVKELREALGDDIVISYDASHSMGIIAGQQFQDPFAEGADFVHGSTHKSLFGAQKGIIMSAHSKDSELGSRVFKRIVPEFVSNAHPHHIAAVGIALEECRDFGKDYARNTVQNARNFALEVHRRGINMIGANRQYTCNHQLIAAIGTEQKAEKAFRRLEAVGINANMVKVPHSNGQLFGLRLGMSEVTRRGFSNQDIIQLANLFADAIQSSRPAHLIKSDVQKLSRNHNDILYTHDPVQADSEISSHRL